jgi:hypothetical protein
MKVNKIDEFTNGWFIGDFSPALLHSKDFEIAVKWFEERKFPNELIHAVKAHAFTKTNEEPKTKLRKNQSAKSILKMKQK